MIPKNAMDCAGPAQYKRIWSNHPEIALAISNISTSLLAEITDMLTKEDDNIKVQNHDSRLSCVGWRDVATAAPALLYGIRLAVIFTEFHRVKDLCNRDATACLNGNAHALHLNSLLHHLQAVKNISAVSCPKYECLSAALSPSGRLAVEALDTTSVYPILCQYCQLFKTSVGEDWPRYYNRLEVQLRGFLLYRNLHI